MQTQEKVLSRIEQSFILLKNNMEAVIGFWIINILLYFIWMFLFKYWVNVFIFDEKLLFQNSNLIIGFEVIIYILALIILQIGIYLWLVHYISEAYKENKPNFHQSMQYWMSKILISFITYYHIFIFVYIIPLWIMIIWLLLILFEQLWIYKTWDYWTIITSISFILLLIFAIYRWTKSVFAIYWAVDNDSFTKDNFVNTVRLTDNNWWRIIWNMLLLWLIIWLSSTIISWILSAIDLMTNPNWIFSSSKLSPYSKEYFNFIFRISAVWIWGAIINWFTQLFTIVFCYIFYKRLEYESGNNIIELQSENIWAKWKENEIINL